VRKKKREDQLRRTARDLRTRVAKCTEVYGGIFRTFIANCNKSVIMGRDSSVGTAALYRLDGRGSNPAREGARFSAPVTGPPSLLDNGPSLSRG